MVPVFNSTASLRWRLGLRRDIARRAVNDRVITDVVDHGGGVRLRIVLGDVPHSFSWCKPPVCDLGYHQAAPFVTIGCALRKVIRQGPFYQIRQCHTHRSALDVPPEPP